MTPDEFSEYLLASVIVDLSQKKIDIILQINNITLKMKISDKYDIYKKTFSLPLFLVIQTVK